MVRSKIMVSPDGYKHDWSAARAMFIEGIEDPQNPDVVRHPTLKEVGEALGIPYQQVRAKAGKERWTDERATAQLALIQKRRKKRVSKLAEESVNFDDQSLAIAKLGQGLVAARMGEIAEELRIRQQPRQEALTRLANGDFVDPIELRSAVWFKELADLSVAATKLQELGRHALGTDVEQIAITLESTVDVSQEITVRQEMGRTDPERLAKMLQIAERANLPFMEQLMGKEVDEEFSGEEGEEPEVVDAEVIE